MRFLASGKEVTSPGLKKVMEERYAGFSLLHQLAVEKESGVEEGGYSVPSPGLGTLC